MSSPNTPLPLSSSIPASSPFGSRSFQLNWVHHDIEQRVGFKGGRFTTANKNLTLLAGLLLTAVFYSVLLLGLSHFANAQRYVAMFVERGVSVFAIMIFFFWSMSILWVKSTKLKMQSKALELDLVPDNPDFELTPDTARQVLEKVHQAADNPANFVLLNRIERALSNLRNIGQVSDVSSILVTQAENDEAQVASSYSLLNGFIWATPVLGFIGTVLGLSTAIAGFGTTLQAKGDLSGIKQSLQGVTAGLSTAFECTLVALVCALIIHMTTTFLQAREAVFLDACNDYCHKNIAAKLRLRTN